MAGEVIGRDEERARIFAFLERGAPAALLLEGEAGIGKTCDFQAPHAGP